MAAASLATGAPVWEYQTDVDTAGHVLNDGCGSVWSSGTLLPKPGVAFDTADCHFANPPPTGMVFALHVDNGRLAWIYRPTLCTRNATSHPGATPNAGVGRPRQGRFLGRRVRGRT